MKMNLFGLRLVIPGVIITVLGIWMLTEKTFDGIGWRLLVGGPMLVVVGCYVLIRNRPDATEADQDA